MTTSLDILGGFRLIKPSVSGISRAAFGDAQEILSTTPAAKSWFPPAAALHGKAKEMELISLREEKWPIAVMTKPESSW